MDSIGRGLVLNYYGAVYEPAASAGPAPGGGVHTEPVIDLRTPTRRPSRDLRARWKAFQAFWMGHAVSVIGDHFTIVALPLAAVHASHSDLVIGLIVSAEVLPVLLGTFVGAFTDRREPRRLMIASDVGRAALLALLAALVAGRSAAPWLLVAMSFALGLLRLVHDGAEGGLVARLVPDELDVKSNNRLVLSDSLGLLIGPLAAGAMIEVGLWLAFGADAVTFILGAGSILAVSRLIARRNLRLGEPPEDPDGSPQILADARGSFRLIFADPVFRRVLAVVAVFNIATLPVGAQFIPLARETLHLSPVLIGLMFSGPSVLTAAVAFAVGGVGFAFLMTHWSALRQRIFEPHEQGKVALTARSVLWSTVLVGSALGGWLSDAVGPEAMWLACGLAGVAAGLWGLALGLLHVRYD